MGNLISFMKEVAEGLRKSGNYGTAHVYRSSMNAIIAFNGSRNLSFKKVNQEFLKSFETYLREKDCSWNTVSTYMRTLRAVHNRAVDRRMASYIPHHFRYVYTGTRADRKRALEKEDMERLMKELPKQIHQGREELQRTRAYFFLMFMLRGMPFVDLAYLKKQDMVGNVLTYRRRKTGRLLTVTLLPETMKLIKKYMNTDSASPYLFPILTGGESTEATYREYQIAHYIELFKSVFHKECTSKVFGLTFGGGTFFYFFFYSFLLFCLCRISCRIFCLFFFLSLICADAEVEVNLGIFGNLI